MIMKTIVKELEIDFIGGQEPLTIKEEKPYLLWQQGQAKQELLSR